MNTSHVIKNICLFAFGTSMVFTSCKKKSDDPAPTNTTTTVTTYTAGPVGTVTVLKTGTIVPQNQPNTKGGLEIVKDGAGSEFIHLKSDFTSTYETGTVVVYLAKDNTKIGDQRTPIGTNAGNVKAIGFVSVNGDQYLKINGVYDGYTNVVLYCETAEINFGAATLQ